MYIFFGNYISYSTNKGFDLGVKCPNSKIKSQLPKDFVMIDTLIDFQKCKKLTQELRSLRSRKEWRCREQIVCIWSAELKWIDLIMKRMASGFRYTVWDPWLILSQMSTLQCIYYVALGFWIFTFDLLSGTPRSLDHIFQYQVIFIFYSCLSNNHKIFKTLFYSRHY